jgi:hypothetical protein
MLAVDWSNKALVGLLVAALVYIGEQVGPWKVSELSPAEVAAGVIAEHGVATVEVEKVAEVENGESAVAEHTQHGVRLFQAVGCSAAGASSLANDALCWQRAILLRQKHASERDSKCLQVTAHCITIWASACTA